MNKKDDDRKGLLRRIFSNKDIQKGIAFLSVALILAFSAVIPVTENDVVQNTIEEDDVENIHYPGYRVINATLEVSTTNFVHVSIQDVERNELYEEDVGGDIGGGSTVIDLTEVAPNSERDPEFIVFDEVTGELNYTYDLSYSRRPLTLLSLPAVFFLFVGMVFAYRGKGVILGEIKMSKQREEAEEEGEQARKEESGSEEGSEGEEHEVVYEGESEKKQADGSHVNFMGIPDEEDEEDEEEGS